MKDLNSYLDQICEPNPRVITDNIQRRLQAKRNKGFLVMQVTIAVLQSIYIGCMKKSPTQANYIFVMSCYIISAVFCVVCRTYLSYFKTFFAITITLIGPVTSYMDREGAFGGLVGVQVFPILLLYYYGSRFLCMIGMVIQLIFLHVLYKGQLLENLNATTPQQYIQRLVNLTTFVAISNTVVIYTIDSSVQTIYKHELVVAEHKRRELETQKTFILSFSHELRNLINAVAGNIQIALLENFSLKVRNSLENAEAGASLLLQLINNILDTGNMEVGELEIIPSPEIVHNTLEKMWSVCSYLLKAKELKGQLRISKCIPRVLKLDHQRLVQILLNLIGNAVKYTQKGSVYIHLDWLEGTTEITEKSFFPHPFDEENEGIFEKDQAFSILDNNITVVGLEKKKWDYKQYRNSCQSGPGILRVTVTDTGCGISPKEIPRIFDRNRPHLRGPNKLKTTLGLFITKELCSKMGGEIKVFSKLDKGTAFTVCLPAEPVYLEETSIMDITKLVSLSSAKKIKAMNVDDLNFNIVVLSNYLQRMGIKELEAAKDGSEAYSKYVEATLKGHPFDLVTMDVEMPVMNGKVAVQKIRKFEQEHNLKPCLLIMVSGNCSDSEIRQCLSGNGVVLADYFLKKPATFDELFHVIAKHFSERIYLSQSSF